MSFWMELRCDAGHINCLSQASDQLRGRFKNVIAGCKTLAKEAEAQGWDLSGEGAICPNCKARRDASAA